MVNQWRWLTSRRPHRHPAAHRLARVLGFVAVTLTGMALGLLLAGSIETDLGPFHARMSIVPSFTGGTSVDIPPLGSLWLDSHSAPAALRIRLETLDVARIRALVNDPSAVSQAGDRAVEDLDRGLRLLAVQASAAALIGALLLTTLVYRSPRRVAVSGATAVAVLAATAALTTATFRPDSIQEPRYEGLLTNAPAVIGDARRIASEYAEYRAQLQRLVQNVSRLYGTISTLPVYEPQVGTVRVLHISDMHLNPAAWSVVQTVVRQFDINLVVDTGDITDWGSEPEESYVDSISALKVPYVYIRGNHDSPKTADAVARQPNAIVVSNTVVDVGGLVFAGVGDPRFTPDKSTDATMVTDRALVVESGAHLATMIRTSDRRVDVALIHDPAAASPLAFAAPVILAGHIHRREVRRLEGPAGSLPQERSLLMVEGSTGGAGLRGLEQKHPLPLALSVLYFDTDRHLQAYDDIRVGGTGLSQVSLERHLVSPDETTAPQRSSPTPAAS